MTQRVLSVLPFTDYRAFLAAHAQEMKRRNSLWSFGAWARHLGLRTTSSLTKIINGARNPGEVISKRLVDYFRFDSDEEQHFRDLVNLQKLRKHPQMNAFLLEKFGAKNELEDFIQVDEATFSTLSEWYCYAIREMVSLDGFLEDPNWISEKLLFSVPPMEVKKAIAKLIKSGLLKRGKNGRLELGHVRINTKNDVASEAIRRYHEQSLDNAKTVLRTVAVDQREISSSTFGIDPKDMPEAKEMLRRFRKRFARSLEKQKGKQIYQLEVAFFPITRAS